MKQLSDQRTNRKRISFHFPKPALCSVIMFTMIFTLLLPSSVAFAEESNPGMEAYSETDFDTKFISEEPSVGAENNSGSEEAFSTEDESNHVYNTSSETNASIGTVDNDSNNLPLDESDIPSSDESENSDSNSITPSLSITTHVQSVGWMSPVSDGMTAGTTGRSLRLEALQLSVNIPSSSDNEPYLTGGISYRAHVESVGWQDWVSDGAIAGTTGRALQIEALQIKLTGTLADSYDVYYRGHTAKIGWMGWAKNGDSIGTEGYKLAMEALEIRLVAKNGSAPGNTENAFSKPGISYRTHIQTLGWENWSSNGEIAGTTGRSLRLEGINIQLNSLLDGNVVYKTHVQNIGWQSAVSNGALSGTTGRSLRLEAIQISLTGSMASRFDIYYRVHVQKIGWMGWAKNGASAGTEGYSYRMEAIQIKLVLKGSSAPGSTSDTFRKYIAPPAPNKGNPANPGHKVIYLTFDDGPGPYTKQLLDVLDKYNVKATFFVTAAYPNYQNMIAQEASRGHTVAIHTYTHDYAKIYASDSAYIADMNKMNEVIKAQTGSYTKYFRFPGGSSNTVSRKYNRGIMTRLSNTLTANGYSYYDWNVSSGDAGETTSTAQVVRNVTSGCANHDISVVLQHDVKSYSVNAVEQIIQWGLANGYTFRAIDSSAPTVHHPIAN